LQNPFLHSCQQLVLDAQEHAAQDFCGPQVESELTFADGARTMVAHIRGHIGSGAGVVAAEAARGLVKLGFWSDVVHVSMQVGDRGERRPRFAGE